MKRTVSIVGALAVAALGFVQPLPATADTKSVIESSPEKYSETREADGDKSEVQIDRTDGSKVYKNSDGVSIKEKVDGNTIKQEYKDENCQRSAQQNVATGDSKVVSEGNCPK